MRVEAPLVQQRFIDGDCMVADTIGVTPEFLGEMSTTWHNPLGEIAVAGTEESVTADRFHVGPDDLTGGGGIKIKFYSAREEVLDDGYMHAKGMRDKAGALGYTGYSGRKSIINVNPDNLSPAQFRQIMGAKAGLMHIAGYTDWRADKPAADERTGPYIDAYVEALAAMGVPYAYAAITCKSDMTARGPATGRMAAAVQRVFMEKAGVGSERTALQGVGFAGLYYAAEAANPRRESDWPYQIPLGAIGDLGPDKQDLTLVTDHPDGFPIDHEWADSLLLHPAHDADLQHEKVKGNRLFAIARKLERAGHPFEVVNANVLTIDPSKADCLTPAATSHVVTQQILGRMGVKRLNVIANNILDNDVPPEALAGYEVRPSELVSAGGLNMSFEERERDLARIAAEKAGQPFSPEPDAVYEGRVHASMTRAARRIITIAEKFDLTIPQATVAVSLANYAMARGARVDQSVRDLLHAPVAMMAV
jgi:hypothetical protein